MMHFQDKVAIDNKIDQLREVHGSSGIPIDETMRWSFVQSCGGESNLNFLMAIPPTAEPTQSSRLLFVGTGVDCRYVDCLGQKGDFRVTLFDQSTVEISADVSLSSRGTSFWKAFFNEERFCDSPVSKPSLILTTGRIRDYDRAGGMTVDGILPDLKKIGDHFGIPVKYIDPQSLESIAKPAYLKREAEIRTRIVEELEAVTSLPPPTLFQSIKNFFVRRPQ